MVGGEERRGKKGERRRREGGEGGKGEGGRGGEGGGARAGGEGKEGRVGDLEDVVGVWRGEGDGVREGILERKRGRGKENQDRESGRLVLEKAHKHQYNFLLFGYQMYQK